MSCERCADERAAGEAVCGHCGAVFGPPDWVIVLLITGAVVLLVTGGCRRCFSAERRDMTRQPPTEEA